MFSGVTLIGGRRHHQYEHHIPTGEILQILALIMLPITAARLKPQTAGSA